MLLADVVDDNLQFLAEQADFHEKGFAGVVSGLELLSGGSQRGTSFVQDNLPKKSSVSCISLRCPIPGSTHMQSVLVIRSP